MSILIIEDFPLQQKLLRKIAKEAHVKHKISGDLWSALTTIRRNKNHLGWILDGYFPVNQTSSSIYDPKEVAQWIQAEYRDLSGRNIEGNGETAMWSVLIRICWALGYQLPPTIILNSAEQVANMDMITTLENIKYSGHIIVSQKPDIINIKNGLLGL